MACNDLSIFLFTNMILLVFFRLTMGLRIDITPHAYTEESTGDVRVSCIVDALDECLSKGVLMLEVRKDGEEPLVFVRQGSDVEYNTDNSKKYQGQGSINKDNGHSFLNLTVQSPTNEDAGLYSCSMYYINDVGAMTNQQASHNLTVDILDVHSTLKSMMKVVSELTVKVSTLKAVNINQSMEMALVAEEVSTLKEVNRNQSMEMALVAEEVSTLKEVNKNQSMEMALMAETAAYTITFSASLERSVILTDGDVVVFGDVQLNHGNAYDATTGVFTAPRNGVYVFNLVLRSSCHSVCYAHAHLKADDITVASVEARKNYEQAGTSVVCELQKGTKVRAVSINTSKVWGSTTYRLSAFSGHLVKGL